MKTEIILPLTIAAGFVILYFISDNESDLGRRPNRTIFDKKPTTVEQLDKEIVEIEKQIIESEKQSEKDALNMQEKEKQAQAEIQRIKNNLEKVAQEYIREQKEKEQNRVLEKQYAEKITKALKERKKVLTTDEIAELLETGRKTVREGDFEFQIPEKRTKVTDEDLFIKSKKKTIGEGGTLGEEQIIKSRKKNTKELDKNK